LRHVSGAEWHLKDLLWSQNFVSKYEILYMPLISVSTGPSLYYASAVNY
jgi:hypothetical protein